MNFLGILLTVQFAELLIAMKPWWVSRHTGRWEVRGGCQPFQLPFPRINEGFVLSWCWQSPKMSGATWTVLWCCQTPFCSPPFLSIPVTGGDTGTNLSLLFPSTLEFGALLVIQTHFIILESALNSVPRLLNTVLSWPPLLFTVNVENSSTP